MSIALCSLYRDLCVLCAKKLLIMEVNPINVIKLLLATFEAMNIAQSPVNNAEIQLTENFERILIDSMQDYNGVEMIQEETLDFQEPYKQYEAIAVDDTLSQKDIADADSDACSTDDELSYDYKKRAIEYWRSGKKKITASKPLNKNTNPSNLYDS